MSSPSSRLTRGARTTTSVALSRTPTTSKNWLETLLELLALSAVALDSSPLSLDDRKRTRTVDALRSNPSKPVPTSVTCERRRREADPASGLCAWCRGAARRSAGAGRVRF
eukprot:7055066-Prymnesium_polylepis.1